MQVNRFVHTNVVCASLEQSIKFYVEILGATIHKRMESGDVDLRSCMGLEDLGHAPYRAALVYFADARVGPYLDLLEWLGEQTAAPPNPVNGRGRGLARIALEVDDLDAYIERFADHDIPPVGPAQEETFGPWRMRLVFFRDPDGTLVELIEFVDPK